MSGPAIDGAALLGLVGHQELPPAEVELLLASAAITDEQLAPIALAIVKQTLAQMIKAAGAGLLVAPPASLPILSAHEKPAATQAYTGPRRRKIGG